MDSLIKSYSKHMASSIILCCFLLSGITGCNNAEMLQKTQAAAMPTTSAQADPAKTPKQAVPAVDKNQSKMDIENFKPIQHCFIKYAFNVDLNGSKIEPISFLVKGKFDLNQDGIPDNIDILTRGNLGRDKELQPYIKVNEVKQDFYMDYAEAGEVRVVDLDRNDKFTEIAIFDEGPSGDPHYIFFRFDGEKLYKLGDMDSDAMINGEGKLISGFNLSHFAPSFYSAWYEITNNAFVQITKDIKDYLDKCYKFAGGEAYFVPMEEMPKDFIAAWGEPKRFKASDLKLLDVYFSSPEDRTLNFYFVEFSNGEKGMLYFWIGD